MLDAVQFNLDPVVLVFFFNKEVPLHEVWHLVTQFIIFPFQIIWLQGHQYWGLLCQLRMPCRSQQFLGNECSGAGSSNLSDCFVCSRDNLYALLFCCSSSTNKDVVPNGSVGAPQSSSGFQHNWFGVPGQMSMADIVKMGRPQVRSSGKPMAAAKQSTSTALPTTFDQGFPALPDPIPHTVNSSHGSAGNNHTHENDWFPRDEPPSGAQSTGIEASGDQSLSVASLDQSMLVADAAYSQENSHAEENNSIAVKATLSSERHLEIVEEDNHFNDGLQNSSAYQAQLHSYVDNEGLC